MTQDQLRDKSNEQIAKLLSRIAGELHQRGHEAMQQGDEEGADALAEARNHAAKASTAVQE